MGFWKTTASGAIAGVVAYYFPRVLDWIGLLPAKLEFLLVWTQWLWQKVSVTVPVPVVFLAIMGMYVGKYFTKLRRIEVLEPKVQLGLYGSGVLKGTPPTEVPYSSSGAELHAQRAKVAEQAKALNDFIDEVTKPTPAPRKKRSNLSDVEEDVLLFLGNSNGYLEVNMLNEAVKAGQLRLEHAIEQLVRRDWVVDHQDIDGRTISLTHEGRQYVIDHDLDKPPI